MYFASMKVVVLSLALSSIFLTSCGEKPKSASSSTPAVEKQIEENPKISMGARVYRSNCQACHKKDGSGISRVNPPLTGTEWVLGDKDRLIGIVLNGFEEKIEVEGVKYNSVMNSFAYLSDEEVAAVLTFIRQSFGNQASEISAEEVQKVRNQPKSQ